MNADFNLAFPHKYCINLSTRPDRWKLAKQQFRHHHITHVRHFTALTDPDPEIGCYLSHTSLYRRAIRLRYPYILIFEDDLEIIHAIFHRIWAHIAPHIPPDWDILYLGGQYASHPLTRTNNFIIHTNGILSTVAYAINTHYASTILSRLDAPIDHFLSRQAASAKHYIISPRLVLQSPGYSDIQHTYTDYLPCMLDSSHERMV